MNWKSKHPAVGNTRVIFRYTLFPKKLLGTWYWLENVCYEQVYVESVDYVRGAVYSWVTTKII